MTKQERMKAFEMHLDGRSWSEIGRALGYSSANVYQDLKSCVLSNTRQFSCIYPAIRNAINCQFGGSVASFADACGMPNSAMYNLLSGRYTPGPERRASISAVIGLPPAEVFALEEDG